MTVRPKPRLNFKRIEIQPVPTGRQRRAVRLLHARCIIERGGHLPHLHRADDVLARLALADPGREVLYGCIQGVTSVRAGHAQHMFADVRQDHVGGDRRDLVQPRFAELALDVVFGRKTKTAMRLQADVGRLP